MIKRLAGAAVLAVSAVTASPASAQVCCTDRQTIVAALDAEFHEMLIAAGLHDPQHIIELWASKDGATWTLLLSCADGLTCELASAIGWSSLSARAEAPGIDC